MHPPGEEGAGKSTIRDLQGGWLILRKEKRQQRKGLPAAGTGNMCIPGNGSGYKGLAGGRTVIG